MKYITTKLNRLQKNLEEIAEKLQIKTEEILSGLHEDRLNYLINLSIKINNLLSDQK